MRRITTIIFACILLGGAFVHGSFAAAECAPGQSAMMNSARVPFVANEGQVENADVKYYARTFGGTVYAFSDGRIIYSLPKFESGKKSGSALITETLQGASGHGPSGAGKSSVAVSSFIGNRPEKWKSNLPVFDRLDFGEVYEGITLLLSARGNNVEKIFVLSPGADPRKIALRYEGALGVEVANSGELELQSALGPVSFTPPVAWQIEGPVHGSGFTVQGSKGEINDAISERFVIPANAGIQARDLLDSRLHGNDREWGVLHADKNNLSAPLRQGRMIPVEVSYALDEDGTVRFELGAYDRSKILIIDPLLASTFIGGGGADAVQAMVVDSQTNVYVAGYTDSSDFPVIAGSYCLTNTGGYDAFVSKFDANLGSLSASTYIGGSSNDQATAIGIDASSRLWLAGWTESTNFPMPSASLSTSNKGERDAFVAILNSGLTLAQATYLGGSNIDSAAAIAMDNSARRQYVVGSTYSTNFPVDAAGYWTNYSGEGDAFAVVFSNDVTSLKGGTFLGGTGADEAAGVVVTPGTSATNPVYVVGSTYSADFPVTNGYRMVYGGSCDAFVSKFSALLTNVAASTFLGGTADDKAYAVGLDFSNKLYVAGYTASDDFPVRNPYSGGRSGGKDIFVSCLTNNLTNLFASTYIGGAGDDVARALAIDRYKISTRTNIYLAGYTASADFPVSRAAYDRSYNGGEDAFIQLIDGRLATILASTYLGGAGNDQALALAFAPDTNTVFVAGITASDDFPASDAAYETIFRGGASDGFASKFPASLSYGTIKWQQSLYSSGSRCSSPALMWDGTVVLGNSTSLYAFSSYGVQRWQASITSAVAMQVEVLAGLGAPAVGTNNVVYINTQSGKVHAITSGGDITEIFETGPLVRWSSIALNNEGQLIFSQDDNLYSAGSLQWTLPLNNNNVASPAISSNGTIYATDSETPAMLYAVISAGSTVKTWTLGGHMNSSPALQTNGIIYAASAKTLYAFNSDGTTVQTWTADGNILSSPAIGTNGVIYVGGGSNLYGFDSGGSPTKVWNTGNPIKSSPAIAADGSIIVGAAQPDDTGIIYSFNPDGTTNWVYITDYYILFQSPLIDSEGTIYISDIFNVYALYGSAPPAESAWPMFRHDSLRTGNQGFNAASFIRPSGLTVAKGEYTNFVRVAWSAVSNALNYELWRNVSDSSATATLVKRLTQTNCNDSSVEPGKVYYYWVKARTPILKSTFSDPDSGGIPPFPPANVTASDGIPTDNVHVTWQTSVNATAYYISRNLSDDSSTALEIGSTSDTNYNDYTVAPGLTHYYWVKAGNANAGRSLFSASDSGGIPPSPPAGLTASQGAAIRLVSLGWSPSVGADTYLVYRNTENNSGTAGIITNTAELSLSDGDVTPLRRFYYWVRATNEYGAGGYSDPALGWGLLAPPVSVHVTSGSFSNLVQVSWVAGSADANAHAVYRGTNSSASAAIWQTEVIFNEPTATNYDDTAITRGMTYYYWVAARNDYGTSAWTAADSPGGTPPSAPTDVNAGDGASTETIVVQWQASIGASAYNIYRSETFSSSSATPVGSSSSNYYSDTATANGVLYYYWVMATNIYGASSLSSFNSGWRALSPPASISASDGINTNDLMVTWSVAPNATYYELWRGTGSNVSYASRLANNIAANYYNDQSSVPGTIYYYWVKSKRSSFISAFSGSDYGFKALGNVDLSVSDFVFLPTTFKTLAHPAVVSFCVSNNGAGDMLSPNSLVRYDVYLSDNPVYSAGNTYWIGGSNATLELKAGGSSCVISPASAKSVISIPDWASGRYYVFVFINHCLPSTWLDPNLSNNHARRAGDEISLGASTAYQPVWSDYDGDGKTDLAVYNETTGAWRIWFSTASWEPEDLAGLGGPGSRPVPRDYDGDGKFDPAVYSEAGGVWTVWLSASGERALATGLGGTGQYAVPADYDGDGKVDPAVYNEAAGRWRVWMSAAGYVETSATGLGGAGWRPAAADYDGDLKTDPAVYNESTGSWRFWLSGSSYGRYDAGGWGAPGYHAAPADYDGDARIDPAVYNESTGSWSIWLSGNAYRASGAGGWGGAGQAAVPGDYDGDGKVDVVVYWESMGIWRLWLSTWSYYEQSALASGGEGFSAITTGE